MRTVAAGTITQALIDTQKDATRTPYIDITINGTNYWSRLEYLEYHEEAYRDRAIIGLNNRDRTLDDLDLTGYEFNIKLGYDTTANGGTTTDTVTYPEMWVKSIQVISDPGNCIYQIYAEGMWSYFREMKVIPSIMIWKASTAYVLGQYIAPTTPNGHRYKCTTAGTSAATEPTWPRDPADTVTDSTVVWTEDGIAIPYSSTFNKTHTVEEIIQLLVESMGWTWTAVTTNTDGIVDVFKPVFSINPMGGDNAAVLLYNLIWMTKGFLRQRPNHTFMFVFPQSSDSVDETYYSYQADWFVEYANKKNLLIPNSLIVLCNQDPSGEWNTELYPLIVGTAEDASQIALYHEVLEPFIDGSIDNQTDADNRAAAILSKLLAEQLGGRLVAPHDCRMELYDKIQIMDTRA